MPRVSSRWSEDDDDGEDDADEAFGEDVEGAAGGEGVAEERVARGAECTIPPFAMRLRRMGHPSLWLVRGLLFGEPVGVEGEGEPEADDRRRG